MRCKIILASIVLVPALAAGLPCRAQTDDLLQPFTGSARSMDDVLEGEERNPFDQSEVGSARRSGDILPMWEVIRRLGPELRGQVVATDIARRDGRWLYAFQVLRGDGRLVRVWANAASGELVGSGR
jgi:uncharacterized membrane protein YkoI